MKLLALTWVVAGVLVASGCGGTEQAAKPRPTVSIQTTCDRMFTQGDPRLWSRATSLVAAESNGEQVDSAEVDTVRAELAKIAAVSKPVIRPHIAAMVDTVAHLDSADTSTYKTEATEVANQCTPYVALD